MSERLGAITWSFPLGQLFHVSVRVSSLWLAVALILAYRLGWSVGIAFSLILFLSVLAHEFGHVMAARFTGGMADEILMWPLGGLAMAQPGPQSGSTVLTILGGPLVNLAGVALFFPGFYAPEVVWTALNPLQLPIHDFHDASWGRECLLLAFSANWMLLLVSLLPIYPLDGGQLLLTALNERLPGEAAHRLMATIGLFASFGCMGLGLVLDQSWIVAAGAILLAMNLLITAHSSAAEGYDDSFMGYDFSQGYTSLERSGQAGREPRPSWIASWKARRSERQRLREAARRLELERQLDTLLEKVHLNGMDALTAQEKRLLQRAADELRHRTRPSES